MDKELESPFCSVICIDNVKYYFKDCDCGEIDNLAVDKSLLPSQATSPQTSEDGLKSAEAIIDLAASAVVVSRKRQTFEPPQIRITHPPQFQFELIIKFPNPQTLVRL